MRVVIHLIIIGCLACSVLTSPHHHKKRSRKSNHKSYSEDISENIKGLSHSALRRIAGRSAAARKLGSRQYIQNIPYEDGRRDLNVKVDLDAIPKPAKPKKYSGLVKIGKSTKVKSKNIGRNDVKGKAIAKVEAKNVKSLTSNELRTELKEIHEKSKFLKGEEHSIYVRAPKDKGKPKDEHLFERIKNILINVDKIKAPKKEVKPVTRTNAEVGHEKSKDTAIINNADKVKEVKVTKVTTKPPQSQKSNKKQKKKLSSRKNERNNFLRLPLHYMAYLEQEQVFKRK